nr:tip elongation aberrant protein 1 isoform X1 [Arachis hypogaea]
MRWEKVQMNPLEGNDGGGPGKRWGHTCNAIRGGRLVYVFGGYGKDNCQTNQVHVFDTVKQTWSQPAIKGTPPTPRDSHTCTAIGDNLYVFGGTDGMNPLKDLHILDTSSNTWISPTIRGEGPEAREGHSAAVVGKRLFIFGGCGKSADNNTEVYYNDLYILNTETFVWKCAQTSGTPPSPRDSHTCSSWKNKIIVLGGEDGHDYYLSDVHILDTDTLIWRELSTSGQLLPPRAGHSTVAFGKNLFVFGGFTDAQNLYNDLYMLDIDTGIWTNVATTTNGPSARFSVAGDCLDPFVGGALVFIGGCNKSLEALDDMYFLYTGIARESEQRPEKLSLRKQLKLKCQEQNTNPVQNQVLVRYGVGADVSPLMTVLNYSQPSRLNLPVNQGFTPGKKMFECKVTESISEGYTIETIIDGKLLRGVLFSNKPKSLHPAANTSTSRKRAGGETDVISNGIHPDKSKISKVNNQDETENRQTVHGESLESHEHRAEGVAALLSSNLTAADTSDTHKVSANPEPEPVSLNRNDDGKNEAPQPIGENAKNDGASDIVSSKTDGQTSVPISNFEVPRHDNKSDAPNCNFEFLKPSAAETAVCLPNQGVMADCTNPRTEECSEPAKLI